MGAGYRGNRTVYGSWLMDEKSLCGLEEVARCIYEYLNEIQENMLKETTEESKDKHNLIYLKKSSFEPQIKIVFSDETVLEEGSFKKIFDILEVREKLPQKIIVSLKCFGIKVDLTLSSGKFSSNYFKYEVLGDEKIQNYEDYKNIVIGKLENWIDENKPDLFLKVWYNVAQWSGAIALVFLVIMWLVSVVYLDSREHYYDIYNDEIEEIAEIGITDENRDRVIELILIKEYEYIPADWTPENSKVGDGVLIVCLIGMLFCIFIRICPKANFSIGKGKKRVKFWNQYRKIVYGLIPTLIVIPILINLLV